MFAFLIFLFFYIVLLQKKTKEKITPPPHPATFHVRNRDDFCGVFRIDHASPVYFLFYCSCVQDTRWIRQNCTLCMEGKVIYSQLKLLFMLFVLDKIWLKKIVNHIIWFIFKEITSNPITGHVPWQFLINY